jgi:hypothetical protein
VVVGLVFAFKAYKKHRVEQEFARAEEWIKECVLPYNKVRVVDSFGRQPEWLGQSFACVVIEMPHGGTVTLTYLVESTLTETRFVKANLFMPTGGEITTGYTGPKAEISSEVIESREPVNIEKFLSQAIKKRR